MVKRTDKISEDDLKAINDSFRTNEDAVTITKSRDGKPISYKKTKVNEKSYTINDFRGRSLKHNKFLIPKGGKQVLIGKKGQLFDDIPFEDRKRIFWAPSDFE